MKRRLLLKWTCILVCSLMFVHCKKEKEVLVYKAPAQAVLFSNVSDFIIESSGKTVSLQATISSDAGLQKVEIIYQPWNINKVISATGVEYKLNENIQIPANPELKIHSITVKATDIKGAVNSTEIKIGLQDLNYDKLYVTDVDNATALTGNLYGVPAPMSKIASHSFQVIYYAKTAGAKLRFIPNKNSFTPVAVGIDPANASHLITDGAKSLPIVLSKIGYYKITINTLLLTYKVENYAPSGTAPAQVALVGRGFYDYPNMNWQNALPDIILMDKDPANPFLFTKKLRLGTPPGNSYTSAQFIMTTNNGWTNFWRFNDGTNPEFAVFNGGTNTDISITSTPVSYLFVFDAQTNLVQAIKQ